MPLLISEKAMATMRIDLLLTTQKWSFRGELVPFTRSARGGHPLIDLFDWGDRGKLIGGIPEGNLPSDATFGGSESYNTTVREKSNVDVIRAAPNTTTLEVNVDDQAEIVQLAQGSWQKNEKTFKSLAYYK